MTLTEILALRRGERVHLPALTRPGCAVYVVEGLIPDRNTQTGKLALCRSGRMVAMVGVNTLDVHREGECPAEKAS